MNFQPQSDQENWRKVSKEPSGRDNSPPNSNWRDSSSRSANEARAGTSKTSQHFKMFTFAQTWPPITNIRLGRGRLLNLDSSILQWTIHGLWPSEPVDPNVDLIYCRGDFKPNTKRYIQPLKNELLRSWPNYDPKFSDDAFWEHQYKKHGTCAVIVGSTNTAYKYFLRALDLLDTYNMEKILRKINILPGTEIQLEELRSKLKKILGVDIQLLCESDPNLGVQYLYEARFCFDTDFRLVDCPYDDICDDVTIVSYDTRMGQRNTQNKGRIRSTESNWCMPNRNLNRADRSHEAAM
ncbi:hypothetical protein QAD02_006268 [Eretmocerus hayati]|uniref:Uncharacterized protein n=1 Tax=Eretmocerus hayati TaxID=131215 RepID=A0ACC2N195_9HYME|nr:hypothetical protein QAD02_006268 [Eretmocerus hayati]